MFANCRDVERTPPSKTFRDSLGSYSSDEASEDGDDFPQTPGDKSAFNAITIAAPGRDPFKLNSFFRRQIGSQQVDSRDTDDASLSLSPVANVFYPSFGDFLPAVKKQQSLQQAKGLGFGEWCVEEEQQLTATEKVDSLARSLESQLELQASKPRAISKETKTDHLASPLVGFAPSSSIYAPFATFSPNTDSFTFFPSPDWKAKDRPSIEESIATTTSASLLSPQLNVSPPSFAVQRSSSTTPPSTPVRGTSLVAPSMQMSRSLPVPTHRSETSPFAAAPSPTRPSFLSSTSLTSSRLSPSSPLPSPVSISFSPTSSRFPRPPPPPPAAYPLSPSDTERIANLHNGRIPTLEQLCPPHHAHPSSQQPIVNTGNQGPMVVQAGDWRCGTCSFVNWRRRKICLRCFPFANDIGNILTIQSQRAAHLAGPVPASAPAHQTHFAFPSPTRSHFDLNAPSSGMERSASFPPNAGYRSYPQGPPSPYNQAFLLVPNSASPTRSTFAPPSPTRSHHASPSSSSFPSRNNLTPIPPFLYPAQVDDRSVPNQISSRYPTSPPSVASSTSALSAGDLALRRSERLNASPARKLQLDLSNHHSSFDDLGIRFEQQQQQQLSPTSHRSFVQQQSATIPRLSSTYQQQQESPATHRLSPSQQRIVVVQAEL